MNLLLPHHRAIASAITQPAEQNLPVTPIAAFQYAFESNHDPKVRERLAALQAELANLVVEKYHDFIRSQLDRWLTDRLHMLALSSYSFALEQFTQKPTTENRRLMEEAERLVQDTLSGGTSLPPVVDCATRDAGPAPAELVNGLWHKGSKLALGGSSKASKTWMLLDLAISVATGDQWLSWETCRNKIFYVNFELEDHFFQKRVDAICEAKGVMLKPGYLDHWCLRGHTVEADRLLPLIAAKCRGKDYAAVILDPGYKLLGTRNENAMNEVAQILAMIDRLIVQTGVAVATAQHFSKGNQSAKESLDRIGGRHRHC